VFILSRSHIRTVCFPFKIYMRSESVSMLIG
jgi:hypothetical protein